MDKHITLANLTTFWSAINTYFTNLFNGHTSNADIHVTAAQKTTWDGKAAGDHTHTQYAASNHTHTQYAATSHGHSYNDLTDLPTIPAAYTHPGSHPASMITGLADVATSGSYNDLSDKPTIPAAYTHPTSHPATMITGLSAVATSGSYADLSGKPTIPSTVAQLSDAGNYALKSDITSVYKFKGSKATVTALPTTGNTVGDVWNVEADGMNYGWTGTEWDAMGSVYEPVYATAAEIEAIVV